MKSESQKTSLARWNILSLAFSISLTLTGCERASSPGSTSSKSITASSPAVDPLSLILAPHEGNDRTDQQIRDSQKHIRAGRNRNAAVEQLGWLFVAKARESFDPGFYKLAEACANVLESESPGCPEGLLLRGHVLENLHHFKEAEPIARGLVAKRSLSFDYALLGDSLMEQGRLDEAADAYQHMMDLRPDLHAYSRAAHLRWLKGDLEGATQMMQAAVDASSFDDREAAAWVCTRLGFYQFEAGETAAAQHSCDMALAYQTNCAPALLLRGRMLLAQNNAAAAVNALTKAEQINPLPEYQWTLAEALRAGDRQTEADKMESLLRQTAAAADPRTFALYLATRDEQIPTALHLAHDELQQRQDVFTHDALAWALMADGKPQEAWQEISRALAEGTDDGRLYFHATIIAVNAGHQTEARVWMKKAEARMHLLLPSERNQFQTLAAQLERGTDVASLTAGPISPHGQ
jgi:tetratricopeptide (TPR) repeat protein